jgi:hypothetical protein
MEEADKIVFSDRHRRGHCSMIRYASMTFEDKVLDLGCGYEAAGWRPRCRRWPAQKSGSFATDMIVEQMLVVLGADVFADLRLRAAVRPHSRPRLIEGVCIP